MVQTQCLCAQAPSVVTRARFVVIRHHKEDLRGSNTARIARLALPNLEMHSYGGPGEFVEPGVLARPNMWLLFPDENGPRIVTERPDFVVVLDGTWSQARKMMQRIPGIRGMPRLALPTPALAPLRLRQQPTMKEGMSTMEAMAGAVALLEGAENAEPLYRFHDAFVRSVLTQRGSIRTGVAPR